MFLNCFKVPDQKVIICTQLYDLKFSSFNVFVHSYMISSIPNVEHLPKVVLYQLF